MTRRWIYLVWMNHCWFRAVGSWVESSGAIQNITLVPHKLVLVHAPLRAEKTYSWDSVSVLSIAVNRTSNDIRSPDTHITGIRQGISTYLNIQGYHTHSLCRNSIKRHEKGAPSQVEPSCGKRQHPADTSNIGRRTDSNIRVKTTQEDTLLR